MGSGDEKTGNEEAEESGGVLKTKERLDRTKKDRVRQLLGLPCPALFPPGLKTESEVTDRIAVGDIGHDFGQDIHIAGKFPVFHQPAHEVA